MSYEDLRLRLYQTKYKKVNITSSLDINPEETKFVIVTREKSQINSKFIYRVELYALSTLENLKSVIIYEAYDEMKHPVKFLNDGRIVVATKYHVIFYSKELEILHKVLHEQINLYDLCVHPDGNMAAIVGQQSAFFWDTLNYKIIQFQHSLETARKCDFSSDGKFFGICDTSNVNIFKIDRKNGFPEFFLHDTTQSNDQTLSYGIVSSFKFNPQDSSEIVVGFSNVSPRLYNFKNKKTDLAQDETNYKIINNSTEQPYYLDNFKEVSYFPDGKRIVSSDYKKGVGLWPGDSSRQLYYKENLLLFGIKPFAKGEKLIGYVWQNVRIIEVQMQCEKDTLFSKQCSCEANQFFYQPTYSCMPCPVRYCQCSPGFLFSVQIGQCVLDCKQVVNSIEFNPISTTQCLCKPGYVWDLGTRSCTFNCKNIPFTTGSSSTNGCQCLRNFQWDNLTKSCVCPSNSNLAFPEGNPICQCTIGLKLNQTTQQCERDCSQSGSPCPCQNNQIYNMVESVSLGKEVYSCRYNCSEFKNTFPEFRSDGQCQCQQKFQWNNGVCQLVCNNQTKNAIGLNENNPTQCKCSLNFQWQPTIDQCGRNCTDLDFVDQTRISNAEMCPCIQNFKWSQYEQKCSLDCQNINNAASLNPKYNEQCICNDMFYWNPNNHSCVINCTEIWAAEKDVSTQNGSACVCQSDPAFNRTFNKQKLICQGNQNANTESQSPFWIWIVLGITAIFVLVVAIIMIKYCCKFATEKNTKQKKLKKTMEPKRRRREKPKKDGTSTQRMSLNK